MNAKKIQELYSQMLDLILFDNSSVETAFIEAEFDAWVNERSRYFDLMARVEELENQPKAELPFTEPEIKALLAVANAALGTVPPEPTEVSPEPILKARRGRKPKSVAVSSPAPVTATATKEDEFVNSSIAMKDPQTGLQMMDENGNPLWLRVKKNPPRTVVPPGYKPPPPQHVQNSMAMNEEALIAQKTRAFKVAGGVTMADLINNAKR